MNVRDLIPWARNTSSVPTNYRNETLRNEQNPFLQLHREMNRLFDDAFRGFDTQLSSLGNLTPWNANWPGIEISETDKELRVTAEIPGVDEKNVEVLLEDDVLILRGEKHSETEDRERQFSERYYGTFERRLPLGVEVEENKVSANFKNGVLTVLLPKSTMAQSRTKRIAINGSTTH
ncbi:Hsp20/alpha crystallin family protein [Devosia sp. CN2-171]|jgi:HSP20 family protein|uniref:Hsp20/alpha crystallin family protein n=1 Tax=Devosia sp. CN2-171 TaxID=3400909 RepID=UPI003BF8C721